MESIARIRRRIATRAVRLVHVAEPVHEHLHHVSCEEGVLLDDEIETPFIHPDETGRFGGDDRGTAGRAVDERHFPEQCAAPGIFHRCTADPDVHRALQQDEHAVALIAFIEENFACREIGCFGFVFEEIGGVHRSAMLRGQPATARSPV